MKKIFIFGFLLFFLTGCKYMTTDVKTIMTDPHYADHQKQLADLESSFLRGQKTFAQYEKEKSALEMKYTKEVQEREQKIHQTPNP